ncbi:replication restart helicase PriA [Salisaeta longa]|uniref:replication restart helicase PriA n=1 Tax=Salisaeta longa TaxID=503170 RepID=UPI0003B60540|nr:primosomal protein N' [Salisaeta longa]
MTVNVAPLLPLQGTFTYGVPDALTADARVGCRVVVPFRSRTITGVIVGEGPAPDTLDFAVKPIADVLDDTPAVSEELLRLTRWMARYYVCSWGVVLKAALPSGTNVRTQRRVRRTEAPATGWTGHARAQAVLRDLAAHPDTTVRALRRRVNETIPLALFRQLADDGLLTLTTTLSEPNVTIRTETHLQLAEAYQTDEALAALLDDLRGAKQQAVVRALAAWEAPALPLRTTIMERADASYSTVRNLADKGVVELVEQPVHRSALDALPAPPPAPNHTLNAHQQAAVEALADAAADARYETFLLHGVTGSGKTEVYLRALKATRAAGRTAIILVPEIALTPQTVQRFRAHVGDDVAVLHSQMSAGERYDTWRALRAGRRSVVIGPRSAVLAPLDNLGLIVVDEEHETSYKQFDPAPRYHARDVAVMRAHQNDAVCILGSATPSLESHMNAEWGKYTRLSLPERVPNAAGRTAQLPPVRVIDLTKERKKRTLDEGLSAPLREAIATRLDRDEQVIVLHNRRGFAPVIECEDCGWAPECTACSVSLTYHKHKRQLRCHYCGRAQRMPARCPTCGSEALARLGQGTQRIEEALKRHFPAATVLRMDRDTTSGKHGHHQILEAFRTGGDILLGTQMIAKGLDFPRVTLVGIVDADVGLRFPDFRAEETTFQLLTQVAGRAGRAERAGEVLLQTRTPKHVAIQCAQAHDYEAFAAHALQERQQFNYPPFGSVASVEVRGPREQRVERLANTWVDALCTHEAITVLGPEPAFIQRVKRQHRYRIILKARRHPPLQQALQQARDACGAPGNGYHVSIDVDAYNLL